MVESKGGKVLLFEPDAAAARLQQKHLERAGHSVMYAATSDEALQHLRKAPIELLVLDYQLPGGINGLEFYGQLKNQGQDLPAILVADSSDEAVVLKSLRAGMRDCIRKSVGYLSFLPSAVERVLKQARTPPRLVESQSRLAGIIETAMDAIIAVEVDGRISLFNPAAERIFGCKAADAIGRPIDRFLPKEYSTTAQPESARSPVSLSLSVPSQLRAVRAQGEEFPVEASLSRFEVGGRKYYTILVRDITERKRAEEALLRAHDDLERQVLERTAQLACTNQALQAEIAEHKKTAEKLQTLAQELQQRNTELLRSNQELDDFAYIASHDLKEPLRGIQNYAIFLIEDYADKLDDAGRAKLETLSTLSRRLEDFIDALLRYSRLGRVDLAIQPTNLNEVLSEVLDSLRITLEETKVDVRIPRLLPTVQCDRVRICEVFRNLVTNALKYNDKPEKWLEVGWEDGPHFTSGHGTAENASGFMAPVHPLVFYVSDNGIGIPEKHFESIFRIFKRLHARDKFGGGSGAGLTIVKKIVERHGGKIWVESVFGVGSSFYFTLHD